MLRRTGLGESMSGMTETVRSVVRADQCDHFGHMNIQFYDAALSDGYFHMMALIGLDRQAIIDRRIGIAATKMELNYRRELRAGDLFRVETGFLEFNAAHVVTAHRLTRLTDNKLALTAQSTGVPIDLALRRRSSLPEDIIELASRFICTAEDVAA